MSSIITKRARILLVTDIHSRVDRVHHLADWIKSNGERIDVVLCAGDLIDVPNEPNTIITPEEGQEYHTLVTQLLSSLKEMAPRCFFIPGNHDPPELFNSEKDYVTMKGMNVHRKVCEILPDLGVAGLGGSVNAFNLGGKKIWSGYPYNEEDVKEALRGLDENMKKSKLRQWLLMTHFGPALSGTTLIEKEPSKGRQEIIDAGSHCLRNYLSIKDRDFLLNYHGHSHHSWGLYHFGNIPIINPGPLRDGKFALLDLTKSDGSWRISDFIFKRL